MAGKKGKKGGYDEGKDELLRELGDVPSTPYYAELRRYDGGELKIAILRRLGREGKKSRQICRLPVATARALGAWLVTSIDES